MNKDKISAFTLRISSSNKTGIIGVLYDIYKEYELDAREAFSSGDNEEAVAALNKCSEVVSHLQKDLNFNYSVSKNLYSLYDYVQRCISRAIYQGKADALDEAKSVMDSLGEAFSQVAKEDDSAPLMKNTQKVVAGYTYGRNTLNESFLGDQSNRGFWA